MIKWILWSAEQRAYLRQGGYSLQYAAVLCGADALAAAVKFPGDVTAQRGDSQAAKCNAPTSDSVH